MAIDFNKIGSFNEERFLVDILSQITGQLKNKYNYSSSEILNMLNGNETISVPVLIFSGNLSPAEALSKFLKENCQLSFRQISQLIGKGEKSTWANYKRASKKMPWAFEIKESLLVPVSIFNSQMSILESLVGYLKNGLNMRNNAIAQTLNKHSSNIWTLCNRAQIKSAMKNVDSNQISENESEK